MSTTASTAASSRRIAERLRHWLPAIVVFALGLAAQGVDAWIKRAVAAARCIHRKRTDHQRRFKHRLKTQQRMQRERRGSLGAVDQGQAFLGAQL